MLRLKMHGTHRENRISQNWYLRIPGVRMPRLARCVVGFSAAAAMAAACWPYAQGQVIYIEDARTQYTHGVPRDSVAKLQSDLDKGKVQLSFDPRFGYLPALLRALKVSPTSQVVVFSKTSVQKDLISPENPRALYYNDNTYVGYVPEGKALELCTTDPYLGAVYYTILQREVKKPRFFRTVDACLECHADKDFKHLPRHILFSTRCTSDGNVVEGTQPLEASDATSFSRRFGGWYVSGNTGNQEHLGNAFFKSSGPQPTVNRAAPGDVKDLGGLYDTHLTLTPYSDIAALMVLTHQHHVQNQINEVTYRVNSAMAFERLYPRAAPINPTTGHSDTTNKTIRESCDTLLKALLFADEARLPVPVSGTSGFRESFEKTGPADRHGRSLRQMDLKSRLFRYRLSYLIYSDSFDAIPVPARRYLFQRLYQILVGRDHDPDYAKLPAAERAAILQILQDTKRDFSKFRS
jgi:hypothetical protein